jgi:excisionase family DNA binding protein
MNETPDVARLLLRPTEAARALAISPRKLWSMTAGGEIPHIRLGRQVRYDPDDLRRWLEELKQ